MFTHLLAGMLFFWIGGRLFDIEISNWWLAQGAFWGCLPDILSLPFFIGKKNIQGKDVHKHRDYYSHYPLPMLLLTLLSLDWLKVTELISAEYILVGLFSVLSHFVLDSFGIGWGIKWFWPFDNTIYKIFYRGRFLVCFTPEELEKEVEKYGDPDWLIKIFPFLTFLPFLKFSTELLKGEQAWFYRFFPLKKVKDLPRIFSVMEFLAFWLFLAVWICLLL